MINIGQISKPSGPIRKGDGLGKTKRTQKVTSAESIDATRKTKATTRNSVNTPDEQVKEQTYDAVIVKRQQQAYSNDDSNDDQYDNSNNFQHIDLEA